MATRSPFIPGGYFAPMYDTREHIRGNNHKAPRLISGMVGGGYRPQCLVAGFLDAENQRFLAPMRAFMYARARSGASMPSITATAMAASAIPITPAAKHYLKPRAGHGRFY